MVAKGSDLVQTAMFVKRAFIELLKKVVRFLLHQTDKNMISLCSLFYIYRVSDPLRQKSSYSMQVHSVQSVMIITHRQYYSNAVTFFVSCALVIGSIANKHVHCAEQKLLTTHRGGTERPQCLINFTKRYFDNFSVFFFILIFLV